MNRTLLPVDDADTFKRKALKWACQFNSCILLDSNYPHNKNTQIQWLLAVDALDSVCAQAGNAFLSLDQFIAGKRSLMAGFLAYDLKNEVEHLESKKKDS
ncbi:MAG: hypothetical protein RMJ53_05975, partial [Chitinophagales bacterium]|nr:hypothetical protein [Chitinophagales bacterium]